jgi:hypothetical protein
LRTLSVPHRRGGCGRPMATVPVAPVTLHLKPFMYTAKKRGISHLPRKKERARRTLLGARVKVVDPEPGAVAAALGARRHRRGDLEVGAERPDGAVHDAEDGEVLGLDLGHVRLVRDGERRAREVVLARRVELGRGLAGARPVGVVACPTTGRRRRVGQHERTGRTRPRMPTPDWRRTTRWRPCRTRARR